MIEVTTDPLTFDLSSTDFLNGTWNYDCTAGPTQQSMEWLELTDSIDPSLISERAVGATELQCRPVSQDQSGDRMESGNVAGLPTEQANELSPSRPRGSKTNPPNLYAALTQPSQIPMNGGGYAMEWTPTSPGMMMPVGGPFDTASYAVANGGMPYTQSHFSPSAQQAAMFQQSSPQLSGYDPYQWMQTNRMRKRRQFSPLLTAYAETGPTYAIGSPVMAMNGTMGFMPTSPTAQFCMSGLTNRQPKIPVPSSKPSSTSQLDMSHQKKQAPLVLPCHLNQDNKLVQQGPKAEIDQRALPDTVRVALGCSSETTEAADTEAGVGVGAGAGVAVTPEDKNTKMLGHKPGSRNNSWFAEMQVTKELFLKETRTLDFDNVTVIELKKLLRKFGLNATGKKAILTERITGIADYLRSDGLVDKKQQRPLREDASEPSRNMFGGYLDVN